MKTQSPPRLCQVHTTFNARHIARPADGERGFTRLELVAVLAALLLLACLALPVLANNKPRGQRVTCFNNLRQIGQAFHVWASDHTEQLPWATRVTDGGTLPDPGTSQSPERNNLFYQYVGISNELGTPKILACPSDANRAIASNFSNDQNGLWRITKRNLSVSYFLRLDSGFNEPTGVLSGDRNFNAGFAGAVSCSMGFTVAFAVRSPLSGAVWRLNPSLHGTSGNVLSMDGVVQFLSDSGMRDLLNSNSTDGGDHHLLVAQ